MASQNATTCDVPRHDHYLKKLKTARRLNHCIYLDTEATVTPEGENTVRHKLKLGWACYSRRRPNGEWTKGKWFYFETVSAFWEWLGEIIPDKTRVIVWAHNMGYDFSVLDGINESIRHDWAIKGAVIESSPFFITLRRSKQTVVFCSSTNIFRETLARLAGHVGMVKGDWAESDADMVKLSEYCKHDTLILKTVIEEWMQFVIDEKLGSFSLTLASQAFTAYRHRFMKHKITVTTEPNELALARSAYLGGRTDCFYIGKFDEPRWLVDVNSMYPYVMAKEKYPARVFGYHEDLDVGDLEYALTRWQMIADVQIAIKEPGIGVRIDKKLIFPIGRFRCQLTTPDLLWVLKHGRITKVYAAAYYESDYLFKRWVEKIYGRRIAMELQGNTLYAWYLKIMLNSLYGKFGQNGIRYVEESVSEDVALKQWFEFDIDTGENIKRRQIGNLVQRLEKRSESMYSCPAIAAHVTAYARRYLWSLICIAGIEHVDYCDTDSLLVDEVGYLNLKPLIKANKLGALSVDLECDTGEIRCPKDYTFGTKFKVKGARKTALWLNESTLEQEQWSSMKRHLMTGDTGGPIVTTITKTMRRVYNKGIVGADGRVSPFTLKG